jgi:predicted nucleic acid-binding protein
VAQLVIADTGPLHYLRLIDQVELLPQLFMTVHIPVAVHMELSHSAAPKIVREWISEPPSWLLVQPDPAVTLTLRKLGAGEHAAIALAVQLEAGLLLTDDRAAVKAARAHGFVVTGTLGVLSRAARLGRVDFPAALARLTTTNFRIHPQLIEDLLAEYQG